MNLSSPSMKGVVSSLAAWKERGIETEVWCWTCDDHLPATIRKLPRIGDVRLLGGFAFSWLVFWRAWWLFKVRKQPRPDVIYSIAWYHKACDVCHVHFSQVDWEKRQHQLGIHSLRDLVESIVNKLNLRRARSFLRQTTARKIVSVSQSVADDMRAENPRIPIQVLPNSYDPQRFHPSVRDQFRAKTRSKLGYDETRRVFIFVSTGHYRRKGFFLAVEALRRLRQSHPEACLLVIGGREERLNSLRKKLGADQGWITFTGMVPDVETYFAAADALLFPSYSEAFALVEVEAAACGLPLFLTPHHGSEMILEDGVNGRLIEFDAERIAQVLAEFVEGRWKPTGTSLKHAVDSATYAQRLGDLLLEAYHTS
jgi:glycosyltransferase involved in cell wall biosynthesis